MKHYCEWCHQAEGHKLPRLHGAVEVGLHCPECDRLIMLVTLKTACQIVQKNRKTMYQWIKKEWVRTIVLTDKRQMVCYSTLFNPPAAPSKAVNNAQNFPRHIVRHGKLRANGAAVLHADARERLVG